MLLEAKIAKFVVFGFDAATSVQHHFFSMALVTVQQNLMQRSMYVKYVKSKRA